MIRLIMLCVGGLFIFACSKKVTTKSSVKGKTINIDKSEVETKKDDMKEEGEGIEDMPVGISGDLIGLSKSDFKFNSEERTVVITTEQEWWWINDIMDGSDHIDFHDTKTNVASFVIDVPGLKVTRKNTKELHIKLPKNTREKQRVVKVVFQAGNYFDTVTITQEGSVK